MNDLVSNVARLHSRAQSSTQVMANLGPLLIRLTVGAVFIGSGFGKLDDLDKVTDFFTELGIVAPGLNATVVAYAELLGGMALTVGLATRLAALPLAMTMVVAILTALLPDVSSVFELVALSEFAYLVMFVSLALTGPGRWSVDHLLVLKMFMGGGESVSRSIATSVANY